MFYCFRYVTRQAGQGDGHGHVREAAPGFPPNSFTGEPHVEGDSRREGEGVRHQVHQLTREVVHGGEGAGEVECWRS